MAIKTRDTQKLISILRAAQDGDVDAQADLLAYFDARINKLCQVFQYTPTGFRYYVDEDMKAELQIKLIRSLEGFDLDDALLRAEEELKTKKMQ